MRRKEEPGREGRSTIDWWIFPGVRSSGPSRYVIYVSSGERLVFGKGLRLAPARKKIRVD